MNEVLIALSTVSRLVSEIGKAIEFLQSGEEIPDEVLQSLRASAHAGDAELDDLIDSLPDE